MLAVIQIYIELNWEETRWIHIFRKGINSKWNISDLDAFEIWFVDSTFGGNYFNYTTTRSYIKQLFLILQSREIG